MFTYGCSNCSKFVYKCMCITSVWTNNLFSCTIVINYFICKAYAYRLI